MGAACSCLKRKRNRSNASHCRVINPIHTTPEFLGSISLGPEIDAAIFCDDAVVILNKLLVYLTVILASIEKHSLIATQGR